MSEVMSFALGDITFEIVRCTDPSTGSETYWVYRTDVDPRDLVATGDPDALRLQPAYAGWSKGLAVLEQAVMDSLERVSA